MSHVFLVHGPKPEKALNASGRLLLQALLDSTACVAGRPPPAM